jgi:hypothetical protein
MNKILLIGVLLIAMVGAGIAGGALQTLTASQDIAITYNPIKLGDSFTPTEMKDFNNIKYEVKGNTIILNKKDVFQNHEITFSTDQNCLNYSNINCIKESEPVCLEMEVYPEPVCLKLENPEDEKSSCIDWEAPKGCIDFDSKIGVCMKWEKELSCLKWETPTCLEYSTPTCTKWTNYDLNYFVKQAIQKEIEFVKGVQIQRSIATIRPTDMNGKVLIK